MAIVIRVPAWDVAARGVVLRRLRLCGIHIRKGLFQLVNRFAEPWSRCNLWLLT